MIDSLRWLVPNLNEPTLMDGMVALAILLVGFILQRYIIPKIIQWNVQFLEHQEKLFFARVWEQFAKSIRHAVLVTVLFFSLSHLFEVSLFAAPKTSKLYISIMVYYVFKGIYDVLAYYTDFPEKFALVEKEQNILAPFFIRIMKVIVMIIALFTIAAMWDFNLNGFFTGIGLTGVAMAFGVRDTLSHIFGGLSVALDKPFQIGDWVATEDQKIEGFIEDINLRSTLIQTTDKGLVYVPNSYLVNRPIYNFTKREKRKCEFYSYLSTENSEELVRRACEEIREQINLHPLTEKDMIHVYIDEMHPRSFRMLIRFYVATNDMGEVLSVKQDILFAMREIFEDTAIVHAENHEELWVHQEVVK